MCKKGREIIPGTEGFHMRPHLSQSAQSCGRTLETTPKKHLKRKKFIYLQPELFNNRDFGMLSRQHQKDWCWFFYSPSLFLKELDFLGMPILDFLPRNAQHFSHS